MNFGFSDGIGYQGQNANSIANHSSNAILFVFKPYQNQFNDVAMRPFQYEFDDNFLAATQEITDVSKNGSASAAALMNQFMNQTNFSDHMVASYQPTLMFHSTRLSDKYRFILVLTDKPSTLLTGNTLAATVGNNAVRRIYSGFFSDEPFNPVTLTDTKRTLNPHATMIFTHKTVVGMSTSHGAYGAETRVNAQASEEIINPIIANSLTARTSEDTELYMMTPHNCMASLEVNGQGYAMAVPGVHSSISNDHGVSVLQDTLEQPTHNVSQVVKGMLRYKEDVVTRGRAMTNRVDALYENDFLQDEASRNNLARWMDIPRWKGGSIFDLNLNKPYSAQTINDLVNGDLDVVDFDLPRPQFYESVDQMTADMTNQYSYLISMVVGPILNSVGLNAMQFVYEIKRQANQEMEQFTTVSAEPHWTVSPQETLINAKAAERELVRGVLRTIYDSKGDFRVEVSANATGMTVVRLDLIGQGLRSMADYEVPTCLGGLISPLIGDASNNTRNSEQLTNMYSQVAGMTTGLDGFNQDDHDFMNFANSQPVESLTFKGMPDTLGG